MHVLYCGGVHYDALVPTSPLRACSKAERDSKPMGMGFGMGMEVGMGMGFRQGQQGQGKKRKFGEHHHHHQQQRSHQLAVAWCLTLSLTMLETRYLQSLKLTREFLAEKLSLCGSAVVPSLDGSAEDESKHLSANYDFDVRASWDCPVALKDGRHAPDNIASGRDRASARAHAFESEWRARSWHWISLHGARGAPRALLCALERDEGALLVETIFNLRPCVGCGRAGQPRHALHTSP